MQTGRFTLTARTVPDCESFLKIRWPNEEYCFIDEFVKLHPTPSLEELRLCDIQYRDKEMNYNEYLNDYVAFTNRLKLLPIKSFSYFTKETITVAKYFVDKASDCLQNARFFAIQSNLLLDYKNGSLTKHSYLLQYQKRCIYFGTAVTWYSNTYDQILQTVYWAYELYTSAVRKGRAYDDTWDVQTIMKSCTYEFVIKELEKRGLTDLRKLIISCHDAIDEVHNWANYIKHKGGIEYKFLEPESPMQIYVYKPDPNNPGKVIRDNRFDLRNFKSPIEIDIDEKMAVIENTHTALYECTTKIIEIIDFDKYQLRFGGTT